MGRLKEPFAIIGCGHSATFYTSEVFQNIGVDVRHELVGSDGIAGWNITHLLRSEYPDNGLPCDAIVFHQVRHPIMVISSVQTMEEETWADIGSRAAARGILWNPETEPPAFRGMKYWVLWNLFAQLQACFRYRVEEIHASFPTMLNILDLPQQQLPEVSRTMNQHPDRHIFEWAELAEASSELHDSVFEMAQEYGYEKEWNYPQYEVYR